MISLGSTDDQIRAEVLVDQGTTDVGDRRARENGAVDFSRVRMTVDRTASVEHVGRYCEPLDLDA
jgi:hypothetical protein